MWIFIFGMPTLYISIPALHRKYHGLAEIVTWSGVVFMVYLRERLHAVAALGQWDDKNITLPKKKVFVPFKGSELNFQKYP